MKSTIIIKLLFTILAAFVSTTSLNAQTGLAGMPGSYLHMGLGARALGMGKAYTALATDPTAIYWNPASLSTQDPYQMYFAHSTLFFNSNMDYVAASMPTERLGSFGFGFLALTSNGFDQRSLLNEELGKFNMMDMAFLFNWSIQAYPGVSIGINYKLVNQRMLDFSGSGHGLDIGLKTKLFDRLDFGFTVVNLISPKINLVNDSQKYPAQIRVGIATTFLQDKFTVSADVAKIVGWESTHLNLGCEYKILANFAVFSGLNNSRFTIGTGFSFNHYGFDYSNSSMSELGMNHRFAVKYKFGGFGVKAKAFPDVFSPVGVQNISKIKFDVKSRKEITRWIFEIFDEEGRLVKNFSENGTVPEQIVWDGRNNKGNLAKDGAFLYRFEVVTLEGKSLKSTGKLVSIDSSGPSGTLGFKKEN